MNISGNASNADKNAVHKKIDYGVLLVEPSATQAKIISRFLKEIGFTSVEYTNSGMQAIEVCRETNPSIILSAMHLKDIRADELALGLFRSGECEETVFILISSERHKEFLEPVRQSGVHTILPKPFQKSQLEKVALQAVEYLELRDTIGKWLPNDFSVLVTDDSSMSRKYIMNVLNRLGIHNIFEASNVDSAIRIMDKNMVSLIISDYQMPNKNGMTLLNYIRKESLQPGVPFLLVSANINHHIIKRAYEHGITNVLAKPFSFHEFKNILLKIIQENS